MQPRSDDRDFAAYNAAQLGRPVRPLARRAVDALPGVDHVETGVRSSSPVAIELGSGAGIEARFLAESGFHVHALDGDPSVWPQLDMLRETHGIAPVIADLETLDALPAADLILSCATLSFLRREAFDPLWRLVREALRPGGVLAADLFGDRDDWAGTEGTYLSRGEVEDLLDGLEVLELAEEERDGRSFAGPKHWHTFQVLARRPF